MQNGEKRTAPPRKPENCILFPRIVMRKLKLCFARLERRLGVLSHDEFSTYEKLYRTFLDITPEMDLYVFFSCESKTQLSRIAARGRPFEQQLDEEVLAALNREYTIYTQSLPANKLMRIDTDVPLDYRELGSRILSSLNLHP